MVNNPDLIKGLKEKIKNIDWTDTIEKMKKEKLVGITKVSNTNYLDWLTIEFLPKFKDEMYEDESFLYNREGFTDKDIKNENDLEYFYDFLDVVANLQRVKEYYNDSDGYPIYEYVFKYKDKYYEKHTIVGQGAITFIQEIEKPDFAIIDFDLYFKKGGKE